MICMILVVEDDPALLEEARKILNRDRRVFLAANAKQAFKLAEDLGFSVALVDLDLRGQSGFELIREMRLRFPDLPVIAICGSLQGDLLESVRDIGAVEVLQKPITPAWKAIVERVRATAHRL